MEVQLSGRILCHLYFRDFAVISTFIHRQCIFYVSDLTIEAKTGRKRVAVATLLVHSVKVAISRHKMIAIAQGGMFCKGVI